ncbi:hypothetical protein [Silvibacterium dinghuense]|uniref:Uncharacterized protein n=1 Tax=Silvibacterium dinghuense TaxID=1560006 RepID=A0A4Q1SII4_9BACT|nr:hypothetical protein [Silvibacterium dinghuense]RXS97040.1 hypothetical protein ESZ00_03675 [Silvibacterium dinghuense]GGG95677.1 hypothetical protein GCM10011586_08460 [Silvibacterium dinghuense]
MRKTGKLAGWGLAGVLLAGSLCAGAQPNRDRLILKDGSYQLITRYEIKGDRVRYFSAERDQWEELPTSLVDWKATETWNRAHDPDAAKLTQQPGQAGDTQNPDAAEAARLDAEETAARNDEMARMPLISPGLRLPDETGVWILDTYESQPELVHALQANGDLDRTNEHSVVRAQIRTQTGAAGGAKELIRIEGAYAAVQLHVNDPVIYVSLDVPGEDEAPDSAMTVDTHGASAAMKSKNAHSSPDSSYVLVRLTSNHNLRTATAAQIYRMAEPGHTEEIIETKKELLPGARWMKLTPVTPLLIGEYALMERLSTREINLDVWSFGVNPRAKENKDVRTAVDEP